MLELPKNENKWNVKRKKRKCPVCLQVMGGIAEVDKTGLVTSLSSGEVGKNFVEKQDNSDFEEKK